MSERCATYARQLCSTIIGPAASVVLLSASIVTRYDTIDIFFL